MVQIKERLRSALQSFTHPARRNRPGLLQPNGTAAHPKESGEAVAVTNEVKEWSAPGSGVRAGTPRFNRSVTKNRFRKQDVLLASPGDTSDGEAIDRLKEEVNTLKRTLNQVLQQMKQHQSDHLPEQFERLRLRMLENDIHRELASAILNAVLGKMPENLLQDRREVEKRVATLMLQLIRQIPPLETIRTPGYRVAVVGPTGVGKTTTLAKIAANLKLNHGRKVALITADTYRIAAIEQLQTFANIAGIPLSVVYSPTEMQQEIQRYRDCDFILIDTVGRSQKNQEQLKDLQQFLAAAEPHETHLVLSLTNGRKTLMDVATRFRTLKPDRFIFTKLDEAAAPGVMLNLLYKFQLPVAYLTNGQTVPTDLRQADMRDLLKLIFYGTTGA